MDNKTALSLLRPINPIPNPTTIRLISCLPFVSSIHKLFPLPRPSFPLPSPQLTGVMQCRYILQAVINRKRSIKNRQVNGRATLRGFRWAWWHDLLGRSQRNDAEQWQQFVLNIVRTAGSAIAGKMRGVLAYFDAFWVAISLSFMPFCTCLKSTNRNMTLNYATSTCCGRQHELCSGIKTNCHSNCAG